MTRHGIHHVTAIAGAAQRNLDFYTKTLGMRLVKRTVNFDDPGTYHLYYGDETGQPGTILTFFPWAHVAPGRLGVGETQETMLRVPESAIGYWTHRFVEASVAHDAPVKRFGETVLTFRIRTACGWRWSAFPASRAEPAGPAATCRRKRRFAAFTASACCSPRPSRPAAILTDVLGFAETAREALGDPLSRRSGTAHGGIVDIRPPATSCPRAWAPARCITSRSAQPMTPRRPRWWKSWRRSTASHHRAARPQLFPLGLFPRAGRRAVRDRHRRAGLRRRRAGRRAGQSLKLPPDWSGAARRSKACSSPCNNT